MPPPWPSHVVCGWGGRPGSSFPRRVPPPSSSRSWPRRGPPPASPPTGRRPESPRRPISLPGSGSSRPACWPGSTARVAASARPRCSPGSRGSRPTGRAGRAARRSSAASAWRSRRSRWRCRLALVFAAAGPSASRGVRAVVVGLLAAAVVVGAGRALAHDPFLDPYCWRNCTDNVFLVRAEPGIAKALDAIWLRLALVAGVFVATAAAGRLATGAWPARRLLAPVLLPGILVGAGTALYAVALLDNPAEHPDDPVSRPCSSRAAARRSRSPPAARGP